MLYLIRREYIHYTDMRQGYLASKSHSYNPKARTVLITSIPHEMCTEKELRIWASFVPGGVQNIWIYRDTRVGTNSTGTSLWLLIPLQELNKAYVERLTACEKLEAVASRLLRLAVIEWRKRRQVHDAEELYRYKQRPGSVLRSVEVGPVVINTPAVQLPLINVS